jgi:hypothetical protein
MLSPGIPSRGKLQPHIEGVWGFLDGERSPLERQVADVLRRARRLPIGEDRNDLRQLAIGLLWLHRKGKGSALRISMNAIGEQLGGTTLDVSNEKGPAD